MKKLLTISFTLLLAIFLGACNADDTAQNDTNGNTDIIDEDVNDTEMNQPTGTNGLGDISETDGVVEDATNQSDGIMDGETNRNGTVDEQPLDNEATDGTMNGTTNGTGAGTETGAGAGINGGTTDNGLNPEGEHHNEIPGKADEESK